VKLWYYCPMFRYERPQAGRFREHYQIGVEAIGSADPTVDAEVIALLAAIYTELGVDGVRLNMNSMGDAVCRPAYVEKLRGYLRDRQGELCGDCLARLELNPLRTFDCKVESCRAVLDEAPRIADHLCLACRAHFETVLGLVRRAGLEPHLDYRLVRGLDYYTRTTFEISSDKLGAQSGVGGGGRYDGLIEQLGGPTTPGVGWGSGLERITQVMRPQPLPEARADVFLAAASEPARALAFGLAQDLRAAGFAVEMDLAGRSLKGQLKHAGRLRATLAVIAGLDELGPETVRLHAMSGRGEEDVPVSRLVELVSDRLRGDG
jgi:histidyl-tRNA synthetase